VEWTIENNLLVKEFVLANFTEAVSFVNKILPLAEAANHHPDVLIHSYKKVKIILFSHSEGKITDKDYSLANKIDGIKIT
jgi:4a-hydroxytetrahydrobiopterin dehydratase